MRTGEPKRPGTDDPYGRGRRDVRAEHHACAGTGSLAFKDVRVRQSLLPEYDALQAAVLRPEPDADRGSGDYGQVREPRRCAGPAVRRRSASRSCLPSVCSDMGWLPRPSERSEDEAMGTEGSGHMGRQDSGADGLHDLALLTEHGPALRARARTDELNDGAQRGFAHEASEVVCRHERTRFDESLPAKDREA